MVVVTVPCCMLVTHKYKMTRKRLYHTTLRRKCRNYSTQSNDHRRYINSLTTVRRGWVGRPFWCGLVNQFGWYKYSHRVVGPFYSIILCEKYITIVNHQDQQVWLMNPRKPFTDLRFFRVVLFFHDLSKQGKFSWTAPVFNLSSYCAIKWVEPKLKQLLARSTLIRI